MGSPSIVTDLTSIDAIFDQVIRRYVRSPEEGADSVDVAMADALNTARSAVNAYVNLAPEHDQLIRRLTRWIMQSGWVKDYEHARAEAESFAAGIAGADTPAAAIDSLANALMHAGFSPHRWFNAELTTPELVHTRSFTDAGNDLAGALGSDWIATANAALAAIPPPEPVIDEKRMARAVYRVWPGLAQGFVRQIIAAYLAEGAE